MFPDPAMTTASIDRLAHHSTIIEMNVDNYRQRAATSRKKRQDRKAKLDDTVTNTR